MNICAYCIHFKESFKVINDKDVINHLCTIKEETDPITGNKIIKEVLCTSKNNKGDCKDFEKSIVGEFSSIFNGFFKDITKKSFWS